MKWISKSANIDSKEAMILVKKKSDVAGQGDDEALPQPYQVDEELGGECSRGRCKTTGLVCNATATTIIGSMGLARAAASELQLNIWGDLGEIFEEIEVLPEAFSEELDSIFESNLLAVRSTIAHTDVVIEDSNRHSSIGYLVKKQAEEYVFF